MEAYNISSLFLECFRIVNYQQAFIADR